MKQVGGETWGSCGDVVSTRCQLDLKERPSVHAGDFGGDLNRNAGVSRCRWKLCPRPCLRRVTISGRLLRGATGDTGTSPATGAS